VDKIFAQFKIQGSTKELHLTDTGVAAGRGMETQSQSAQPPPMMFAPSSAGSSYAPALSAAAPAPAAAAAVEQTSPDKIYVPGLGEVLASSVPPEALAKIRAQQLQQQQQQQQQSLPPPRVNYEEIAQSKKDYSWLLPLGILLVLLGVLGYVFRKQLYSLKP
jgi:hypothetical protein